jgi:hypothetical protein
MTQRRLDPFQEDDADPGEGVLPNLDLDLGGDEEAVGDADDDLASLDEENMYGNDVVVKGEFENRS